MSELNSYPIHRVVHRINLFLEADRLLMMCLGGLCAVVAFYGGSWLIAAIAVGLWIVCAPLLRHMAKIDPLMRQVYQRYYRLQTYYPARSTPFCQTSGLNY